MKLVQLKVRRVREIEDLVINFEQQFTVLHGENGTGKTTVLFCIIFALTGEMFLKGSKAEHVRDIGDGPSWASITFEHMGKEYTIKRFFSAATVEFKDPDLAKPLRKATAVDQHMRSLGIPVDRIRFALLPQGNADRLFNATDKERIEEMMKIFNLTHVAEFDAYFKQAADAIPTFDSAEEELESTIALRKTNQERLEKAQADYDVVNAQMAHIKQAEKVLEDQARAREARSELLQIETKLELKGEELAQVEKRIAELSEIIDTLSQQLDPVDVQELYDSAKQYLVSHEAWKQAIDKRQRVIADRDRVHQELSEAEADLIDFDKEFGHNLQESLSGFREDASRLSEEVEAAKQIGRVISALRSAEKARETCKSRLRKVQAELDDYPAHVDVMRKDLDDVLEALAVLKSQTVTEDGKCPTCGQEWKSAPLKADHDEQVRELQEVAAGIRGSINEYQALLETKSSEKTSLLMAQERLDNMAGEYDRVMGQFSEDTPGWVKSILDSENPERVAQEAADHFTTDLDQLQQRIEDTQEAVQTRTTIAATIEDLRRQMKSLEDRISDFAEEPVWAGSYKATDVVSAYDNRMSERRSKMDEKDQLLLRAETLSQSINDLEESKAQVEDEGVESELDEKAVDEARQIVAARDEVHARYTEISTILATAKKEIEELTKHTQMLEERVAVHKRNVHQLQVLNGARWLAHRDQLSRFACGFYASLTSEAWQQQLEELEATFTAWQEPQNLEFFCQFMTNDGDAKVRRVYQTSGGERQGAIVAYWWVINQLFASDLGFIMFDEPTTHVDARVRPTMARMFQHLARQAAEIGLQVVLVDHAVEFLSVFPRAIQLEKTTA